MVLNIRKQINIFVFKVIQRAYVTHLVKESDENFEKKKVVLKEMDVAYKDRYLMDQGM